MMFYDVPMRLLTTTAKAPTYATCGSAGADLYADADVVIQQCETKLIPTGVALAIPSGFVGLVCPRSGLSLRTALRQPNSVGVIDSDYRGEICGMFCNTGTGEYRIERGTRIAQLVIVPVVQSRFVQVDALDETARGTGGFGHTGIKEIKK